MAFLGDITLGQYYPGDSFLHNLDPRNKILASLFLMACLLFVHTIHSLALYATCCVWAWAVSGLPSVLGLRNLRPFIWLLTITISVHAFNADGRVMLVVPGIGWTITDIGLLSGVIFAVRLALLIEFAALLTLTTPPTELTEGLQNLLSPLKRFKIPVHELALMMMLTLRFVPILIREAERVRNAQLSRGAILEGGTIHRVRVLVAMLLPLLTTSLRKAEDLAVAMTARGYLDSTSRTSFRLLRWRVADSWTLAGVISMFIAALVLEQNVVG